MSANEADDKTISTEWKYENSSSERGDERKVQKYAARTETQGTEIRDEKRVRRGKRSAR
jgi:hypothetical protein